MLHLDRPVIVEGKYDKIRLRQIVEGTILTTDGFGIFKASEKTALIRRLAAEKGVLVLTDSDGAGRVIRNFLRGCLPAGQVTHLYIPARQGKEKRKKEVSREGLLGVEGMDTETLERLLRPYTLEESGGEKRQGEPVTKTDFFEDGLSGGADSAARRKKFAESVDLPAQMSANALLEAVNLLYTREQYRCLVCQVFAEEADL